MQPFQYLTPEAPSRAGVILDYIARQIGRRAEERKARDDANMKAAYAAFDQQAQALLDPADLEPLEQQFAAEHRDAWDRYGPGFVPPHFGPEQAIKRQQLEGMIADLALQNQARSNLGNLLNTDPLAAEMYTRKWGGIEDSADVKTEKGLYAVWERLFGPQIAQKMVQRQRGQLPSADALVRHDDANARVAQDAAELALAREKFEAETKAAGEGGELSETEKTVLADYDRQAAQALQMVAQAGTQLRDLNENRRSQQEGTNERQQWVFWTAELDNAKKELAAARDGKAKYLERLQHRKGGTPQPAPLDPGEFDPVYDVIPAQENWTP